MSWLSVYHLLQICKHAPKVNTSIEKSAAFMSTNKNSNRIRKTNLRLLRMYTESCGLETVLSIMLSFEYYI